MYIEAIERFGKPPVRLEVSQVVIYRDDGTPISLASLYGPDGAIFVETAEDPEKFNKALQTLGIDKTVIVDNLVMSEPTQ
jgi:hypothetical protein